MATVETLELSPQTTASSESAGDLRNADIKVCDSCQLSYNDFFWNHMHANLPVVLRNVAADWECFHNWTLPVTSNAELQTDNRCEFKPINFDYLKSKMGNCQVPVVNCSVEYYNSHAKRDIDFHDFLDYWQAKIGSVPSENSNNGECNTTCTKDNLYLKDWHLKAQMPDYNFYQVPKHFASDWLNEQLVASGRDDYRFVYMGPKGSWTPFHADVFGSYSWSTNIVGMKKWILLPPGEELKLTDRLGNLPSNIDETQLAQRQVRYFRVNQLENVAIFVPSGWYHQVWNVSDTISVNHNWFNACNVQQIWKNLSADMQKVITEIEDCRQMDNFEGHCQTMLRASFGINYLDFVRLLEFIAERRLAFYNNNNGDFMSSKLLFYDKFTPNDFHIRYDLQSIRAVVESMLQDVVVCDSRTVLYRICTCLKERLKEF